MFLGSHAGREFHLEIILQRKFTLSLLLSSDFSPVAQFCSEDSCVANSY